MTHKGKRDRTRRAELFPGLEAVERQQDELEYARRTIHKPTPTQNLMMAVVDEVRDTLHRGPGAERDGVRIYHEARAWIESEDRSELFAFVTICHVMSVDVGAARAQLLSIVPGTRSRFRTRDNPAYRSRRAVERAVPSKRARSWFKHGHEATG